MDNQITTAARLWNAVDTFLKRRLREGASDLQTYLPAQIMESPEVQAVPGVNSSLFSTYIWNMVRSGQLVRNSIPSNGSTKRYAYRLPREGEATPEKGWANVRKAAKPVARKGTPVPQPIFHREVSSPAPRNVTTEAALFASAGNAGSVQTTAGWHAPTLAELMELDMMVRSDGKGLSFRTKTGQRLRVGLD